MTPSDTSHLDPHNRSGGRANVKNDVKVEPDQEWLQTEYLAGQNEPLAHVKGRGSLSNEPSRYLQQRTEQKHLDSTDAPQQIPATQLMVDQTRRLITRNQSPDIPFEQSINPYKGCEHGCVYCFARPTHAYLDLSPGLDFETIIFRKANPREHLLVELSRSSYTCTPIAMGTNTDPYQPLERSQQVTREILEVMLEAKHPVTIVTKSKLILRDIDLLSALAEHNLVHVHVSVTTLDNQLKGLLEPRTAGPAARLRVLAELRNAGIPTGAMLAPIIPFINDHEIESLLTAVHEAGAQCARYILLRLPLEVQPIFEEWLHKHYSQRADRVMAAIVSARDGKAYRAQWHTRMVGTGPVAELFKQRFAAACRKLSFADALPPLRCDLFAPPVKGLRLKRDSAAPGQMSLF